MDPDGAGASFSFLHLKERPHFPPFAEPVVRSSRSEIRRPERWGNHQPPRSDIRKEFSYLVSGECSGWCLHRYHFPRRSPLSLRRGRPQSSPGSLRSASEGSPDPVCSENSIPDEMPFFTIINKAGNPVPGRRISRGTSELM